MVKLWDLQAKLKTVNVSHRLSIALYFYEDLTYTTIYGIIGPYKNYPN